MGCDFWIVDQHRNVMLAPKHGKIGSVGATTDDSVLRACHKHIQGGTRRSSGSPPPQRESKV